MIKPFCYILFLSFLLSSSESSFAQDQPWTKLQSPVSTTLRQLSFVDSLTGWAAGEAGTIIRTTDGGINWEIQNSTVQTFILDVFFLNRNLGWALSIKDDFPFNPVIIKTTNGGETWIAEDFPDSSKYLRTIFFADSLNGYIGGSYIGYTTDGGSTWAAAEIDSSMVSGFPIYNFNFYSRQFGYACGGRFDIAGVVWRTTNSGMDWSAQGVSTDEVFDLYVLDSLNAIALSGDPESLYPVGKITTRNAGETWNYEALSFFGLSFAIDFRTYNEGWSASGYKFILTTDRGETWSEFKTPGGAIIYDLQFTDSRNGYAVGDSGIVLKTDPALLEINDEPPVPGKFVLYQNYPNPFNPNTNIKFTIPSVETTRWVVYTTLKVYDVLGNEIATLVNEEKLPGTYEVEFSPGSGIKNLSSGIYFYQLRVYSANGRTGSFVETKKMILLK